jgi:hypothetical protein
MSNISQDDIRRALQESLRRTADQAASFEQTNALLEQLRFFATAILAAVMEPETMRSNEPAPAIEKAALLLDRIPEYLPFENLSIKQEHLLLHKWSTEKRKVVRLWKMDQGPLFTLELFIETPDSEHKSLRELKLMLKRVGFPFLETAKKSSGFPSFWPAGQITLAAYQYALQQGEKRRQKRRVKNQQKRRAKQV